MEQETARTAPCAGRHRPESASDNSPQATDLARPRNHEKGPAVPRSATLPPPAPAPATDADRRCVDCGLPCTEQVSTIPRLRGGSRTVYACSVHAARRRKAS